jgi:hypothetical protein
MELLPAFVLGFIVGLIHDLGLVVFRVGKWGDHYQVETQPSQDGTD